MEEKKLPKGGGKSFERTQKRYRKLRTEQISRGTDSEKTILANGHGRYERWKELFGRASNGM